MDTVPYMRRTGNIALQLNLEEQVTTTWQHDTPAKFEEQNAFAA